MSNFLKQFIHFWGLFLISLILVIIIRYFIVSPFLVRGESMAPNFANLDYLFVERVSYYFQDPGRGEPIVFRFPHNRNEYFIKRVIGIPGDRLVIKDGRIFLISKEGELMVLEEAYLPQGTITGGNVDVTLNADEYYVLGDNREASFDSRRWGVVSREDIVGRVMLRVWPLSHIRFFATRVEPSN